MKLYIKKLWSTHPNLYIYIEINKALREYNDWCGAGCVDKTFEQWVDTEIDTQPKVNSKCFSCGGKYE